MCRKHDMEGPMQKATNRSWDKVYVVIHGPSLSCYKDQKHAKQDPSSRIHHEAALDLSGAECERATDYKKMPNVFRLRLASGGEYLFIAKDQPEMELWINVINSTCSKGGTAPM
ncbi:spectrin beta chain, non-erythrocytic 1-like [Mercenaria mercenaria]|uniref:spectrin beta chain, non-erythrocytic 1-like n=1 Tax=Mercenaria mercenaria TaxID=6596 RepID=UPI00234EF710|nr:spectrin beta chain, non-erythrocytic 1-like [Mercenaria mercenaria]